ncbi:unnamed protein product [Tetraodon nigroviridis]|uniref:Chromosome undetermined SCAF13751, whole genome shotgun sequence n=1 Tax=Tetraodon nigroviridis TaxID=99883 RepID=Q4SVM6_TETNG|nr:unnamed protein product [Tetraodon nigroviridis]
MRPLLLCEDGAMAFTASGEIFTHLFLDRVFCSSYGMAVRIDGQQPDIEMMKVTKCHLPSKQRLPCGPASISKPQCHSKGCCFSSQPPTCYYSMDDAHYSSYYPQYHRPLHKLLGRPLYMEVRLLNNPDPTLVLLVHYCVAYPRSGNAVWILFYNGYSFSFVIY